MKPKPICTHCGLSGHTIAHCCKIHGYILGYKVSGNAKGRFSQNTGVNIVYVLTQQEQNIHQSQNSIPSPGSSQPQTHTVSYNRTTYVPIDSSYNHQGVLSSVPNGPVYNQQGIISDTV